MMLFLFSEVLGVRDELWRARRVLLSLSSLSSVRALKQQAACRRSVGGRYFLFGNWLWCAHARIILGGGKREERESDFGRAVGFKRVKLILDRN